MIIKALIFVNKIAQMRANQCLKTLFLHFLPEKFGNVMKKHYLCSRKRYKCMADLIQDTNNIQVLQSPLEQLREVDTDGKEWWNSRKLARVMGYGKYLNFTRVIAKAQAWTSQKGYHLGNHFVEITEMAELGSGAVREVTSVRLSRAACMAVAMNADPKKEMVKAAQQYFSSTITPEVAARSMESSILMYKSGREKVKIQVVFDTNTFWLSQQRMAELLGVTQQNISYHLQQIEDSGEIHLSEAYKKILLPSDKWSGEVMMYNLDVVIAVGYRVNSYEATQFRIWATNVLKEYLTKGFVLDDERLKGKNVFGSDYFDDLLERIREIRISERRYYQKITDIYSECSSDYDKDSDETRQFFKTVQNMMHYAVTQKTASLNRLSNAFIDIAEQRAEDHILMTMADWSDVLKRYMELNNRPILEDAGHVTHEQAVEKALNEYDKFRVIQDREIMSDFDKQLELLFGSKI